MREVYIVDGVRTAIGRMGGTLKDIEVDFLSSSVMEEVLQRSDLQGEEVDEVIWGNAKQSSDTPNLAHLASLRAGFPIEVPGYTVHRQCGSGLQSINNAAQQIMSGLVEVVVAGGGESMSTAPYYLRKARYGYGAGNAELVDPNTESQPRAQPIEEYGNLTMGLTAENLAEKYNIDRMRQDKFALNSQKKANAAIENGHFKDEILPFKVKQKRNTIIFDTDEHPRKTSMEKLTKLPAVFKEGGSVTPGNASGRNDGAAALVVVSEDVVKRKGLKPRARIISQAVSGVDPSIMGIGPVPATNKALKQAGLKMEDIDLIELNEAFAAQSLAVIEELGIDESKLNVNGGAIALGHPIGATGAVLMVKLLHEMERRGSRYGLVTLCIGGGQGISTVVENLRV
ncbi:thiolase family protein [Halobacillus mangrovi]|uniref:acetyl-CoA C-acetyltransferase n=1 Tax=Halobacillus mangrovi TaxID=402384 RepID=A0A1W5ZUD3_9BACI|nr:thiolase family protein [Halobacillus mangrovi]ARI76885.1 acetyl-CoA acetyltransferase [Halobacillus mangrovi]